MGERSRWPLAAALVAMSAAIAFVRPMRTSGPEVSTPVGPAPRPAPAEAPEPPERLPCDASALVSEPPPEPEPAVPPAAPPEAGAAPAEAGAPPAASRVRWSGALRAASGALLGGIERLRVESLDGASSANVPCDAFGRFSVDLNAGTWRVLVPTASGALELATLELAAPERIQDVVVRGVSLCGKVRAADEHRGVIDAVLEVEVELCDEAGAVIRRADLRAGSHYTFLALAPGRYHLATSPQRLLGASGAGLAVHIDGARERVTVDLLVGGP